MTDTPKPPERKGTAHDAMAECRAEWGDDLAFYFWIMSAAEENSGIRLTALVNRHDILARVSGFEP